MTPMTLPVTPTAKYYRVSQYLQQQIIKGEFPPNQQLPTEEVLTKGFGVSRGTVRKAIDLLETQGLVRREQGRGTFVNDPSDKGMAGFTLSDFAKEMQQQHRTPTTRVLKQEVVTASAEIAAHLNLNAGDDVLHIERLRLADNRPIVFEERYLNPQLCPELVTEDVETQSIHWLLVHKYKLPLVRVTHTVEIREAGEWGEVLGVGSADQIFAVARLTYTKQAGKTHPAVYYRAFYHGDEYQFKAQFNTMI